jgi:hypothetical protein
MTGPRDYGPVQLADYLGLPRWQLERALAAGLVPAPDRARGRWSAAIADDALARIDAVRAAAGSVPDLGAVRAAEILTARLGTAVSAGGVAELARRGLIRVASYYKSWPVYDGRDLEAFSDPAAAADATRAGQLRTADESAAYLRIRRSDFDHLPRAGLLVPADWGHGPYDTRRQFSVPLYRTGDLDGLAARPDIDWAAARAATSGQRSPLAALPSPAPGRNTRP